MISKKRKLFLWTVRGGMYLATALTAGLTLFLMVYVLAKGIPNITWELLSTKPSYLADRIGILPDILNTLYIIIYTLILVLPLGVGAAIYLTEYATNRRLVAVIEFATETLTGIPSIIFGLVGMLFFIQLLGLQQGILAGGLTLVVMILPTMTTLSVDGLRAVPDSYRQGSLALGYTRWQTIWHVVLKSAMPSLMTAVILGMTRAFGETLAVRMVIGGIEAIPTSLLSPASTITTTLTTSMAVYAEGSAQDDVLWALGLLLMGMSLIFILIIHLIGRKGAKARG